MLTVLAWAAAILGLLFVLGLAVVGTVVYLGVTLFTGLMDLK
jgi:hypothetical protein